MGAVCGSKWWLHLLFPNGSYQLCNCIRLKGLSVGQSIQVELFQYLTENSNQPSFHPEKGILVAQRMVCIGYFYCPL